MGDRPIDGETWILDGDEVKAADGSWRFNMGGMPEDEKRWIACAPEALRMLEAREWADTSDGEYGARCLECGESEPWSRSDLSGGPVWSGGGVHKHDCRWLALMKKAGIR